MPGAYRLRGTYRKRGSTLALSLVLDRTGEGGVEEELHAWEVEEDASDLETLGARIVAEVQKHLER